ncbi:MAG TPA: beta-ketoacyl-[acyl-carrier-protein] synthase II, partial [Chitinophagaceae bacterium]|nr:beta-ketoacyl-[acyl-carrier-protein] synthase II [Chitinophagaceae bacterium]
MKRVVVTGIGTITPLGNNLHDYWNGLINGVSGAGPITLFDATKFKTRFACEIKGFDPTNFMDRKEARKLDRFAQLAIAVSDAAVTDAGISKENV